LYLGAAAALGPRQTPSPREQSILAETLPDTLGRSWHHQIASSAVLYLLEEALADSALSAEEDQRITEAARLLQIEVASVLRTRPDLLADVTIGRANAGRLPIVAKTSVGLRRREVAYLATEATLMTSSGAADARAPVAAGVPLAKGIRVEAARIRGSLRNLDPQLKAADRGLLLVTDQRLVFEGHDLEFQVPHRRLIGFALFRDGLQIRVAGRRAAPIFKVADPLVVAATANGAWQKPPADSMPRVYAVQPFDDWPAVPVGSARSG
jgi:hypothetical protein